MCLPACCRVYLPVVAGRSWEGEACVSTARGRVFTEEYHLGPALLLLYLRPPSQVAAWSHVTGTQLLLVHGWARKYASGQVRIGGVDTAVD